MAIKPATPLPSAGWIKAIGVSGRSPPNSPSKWKKSGELLPLRALFQPGNKFHIPGAEGIENDDSKPAFCSWADASGTNRPKLHAIKARTRPRIEWVPVFPTLIPAKYRKNRCKREGAPRSELLHLNQNNLNQNLVASAGCCALHLEDAFSLCFVA